MKPGWFRIRYSDNDKSSSIASLMKKNSLHSVCQSAHCPNRFECWSHGTATFMVLGEYCTRACRFCAVKSIAKPPPLDQNEPKNLAGAVSTLGLRYLVITSVTRDDLDDGGSAHFAECIRAVKERNPGLIVEALIPDFKCDRNALKAIAASGADVVSHNIETVQRLTKKIRDMRASYWQSLEVLRLLHELSGGKIITKSGLMVGFGETEGEVRGALTDLRSAGAEIVTIGQYLRPTKGPRHVEVVEFVTPEKFKEYERMGYELGFKYVASGPFVRSSYKAAEPFIKGIIKR